MTQGKTTYHYVVTAGEGRMLDHDSVEAYNMTHAMSLVEHRVLAAGYSAGFDVTISANAGHETV